MHAYNQQATHCVHRVYLKLISSLQQNVICTNLVILNLIVLFEKSVATIITAFSGVVHYWLICVPGKIVSCMSLSSW